jgi:hypothetical protein
MDIIQLIGLPNELMSRTKIKQDKSENHKIKNNNNNNKLNCISILESPMMSLCARARGGVNRRSLEINPASTKSNRETEILSRIMSNWAGLCPVGSDFVQLARTMSGMGFRVGI